LAAKPLSRYIEKLKVGFVAPQLEKSYGLEIITTLSPKVAVYELNIITFAPDTAGTVGFEELAAGCLKKFAVAVDKNRWDRHPGAGNIVLSKDSVWFTSCAPEGKKARRKLLMAIRNGKPAIAGNLKSTGFFM
jgi:hypothetical protein